MRARLGKRSPRVHAARQTPGSPADVITAFLERVPLFASLDHEHRATLATRMLRRTFSADQVVFHRGDPSAHLFVILSGVVKVSMVDEAGREVVIAIEREGEVFGELALLDDAPHSATVTALTPTTVLSLSRADLFDLVDHDKRAARALLRLLAQTVRRASGLVEDLVFLDLRGRIAKCLLSLARPNVHGSELDLKQDDLAAVVGATRVSVNKLLAELEAMGAVRVGRKHIEVVDPALLAKQITY